MEKILNIKIIKDALIYVNYILGSLEDHYYHNYLHAVEVMNRAVYLGKKELLSDEKLEILALACIFHDTGFTIEYDNNEKLGAKIASNYLKTALYPDEKIKIIEELIMATSITYLNPKNILEKIIKDSDMDNLGTDYFFKKGNDLKKEVELIKKIKINNPDWHHYALDILKRHNFYTQTQTIERKQKKLENEKKLEEIILKEKSHKN